MDVLITGGTGFIGSRLALRCLEKGHQVRILGQENTDAERKNKKLVEEQGAEVIVASVTDREKVFESVRGANVVYHLAAAQHEMNVPDERFWNVNVAGTRNVLEASVEAGVERFIHGSTIGVYGPGADGKIDENSPLDPDNIYGKTKLEGERVVLSFKEKIAVVIIRIPETYGPGDHRLLKLFKTIKKNLFFIIGNGKNLHHLIYIDDLNDGLLLAAKSDKAVGMILLLVGIRPITTNEMVAEIAKLFGQGSSKVRVPFWPFILVATIMEKTLRPFGIQPPLHRRRMDFFKKSFSFSTEEMIKVLGFTPRVDFTHGAAKTLAWYDEMGYL